MRHFKKIIPILIVALLIISGSLFLVINSDDATKESEKSLVPSNIWLYQNIKNQPTTAMVLILDQQEWQATAAASITPVFIDRSHSTPIIFDDNQESRNIKITHDTKSVIDFGADAISATANIASTYWSKAEIVLIADSYEHVLWAVPIASFLSAPILVDPSKNTLNALGTKCTIVIGDIGSETEVETTIKLKTIKDTWKFQLDLYETKDQKCDYLIITNPNDASDTNDPNI